MMGVRCIDLDLGLDLSCNLYVRMLNKNQSVTFAFALDLRQNIHQITLDYAYT